MQGETRQAHAAGLPSSAAYPESQQAGQAGPQRSASSAPGAASGPGAVGGTKPQGQRWMPMYLPGCPRCACLISSSSCASADGGLRVVGARSEGAWVSRLCSSCGSAPRQRARQSGAGVRNAGNSLPAGPEAARAVPLLPAVQAAQRRRVAAGGLGVCCSRGMRGGRGGHAVSGARPPAAVPAGLPDGSCPGHAGPCSLT